MLPVVELRAASRSRASELADLERGADDIDLGALDEAARRIAHAENVAVFHGWLEAGIRGIAEACTHPAVALSDDFNAYSRHTAEAVETLLRAGHQRPVRARARPRPVHRRDPDAPSTAATRSSTTSRRSSPAARSSGRPACAAPSSSRLRGGDFLFESGQDLSIGYDHHDADLVHLYLEESFSFRVATPEAACFLNRRAETSSRVGRGRPRRLG